MEHGAVAYGISEKAAIAASIGYLSYGEIDGRDAGGHSTGDITAYDWYGSIGFGLRASDQMAIGLTGKFINQKLDEVSGATFAVDFGMKYYHERFTLGFMVANVGPDMDFDGVSERLPSSARLGVALRPFTESILTSIEFDKHFYGGSVIRHGVEYGYLGQYFVRAGYNYYPDQDNRSFGSGMCFGAGFRFSKATFDYAFTLGDSYASEDLHRLSLVLRFGR